MQSKRKTRVWPGLALCLALCLLTCLLHAGNLEEDILRYTNEYRRSKGKPALVADKAADRQARQHSAAMASGNSAFGHEGFQDRVAAIRKQGGKITAAAENVAYGDMDARQVVDGWIRSKSHRKNMLGDYNRIGIGTARKKNGTLFFTQLFLKS